MLAKHLNERPTARSPLTRIAGAGLLAICVLGVITMNSTGSMAATSPGEGPIAIVVHGGAGTIRREELDAEKETAIRSTLEEATRVSPRSPVDAIALCSRGLPGRRADHATRCGSAQTGDGSRAGGCPSKLELAGDLSRVGGPQASGA